MNKLSKETTHVVIKSGFEAEKLLSKNIKELDIDEMCTIEGADIKSVHAYNTKRVREPGVPFHPEGFGMGVLLTVDGVKLYYAGDRDFIPPMEKLKDEKIDVAFLPIGGIYMMDIADAAEAVRAIEPRMVVPVHFNHVKGTEANPLELKDMVEERTQVKVVIF